MAYSRISVGILEEDYDAFLRLLQPDEKLTPKYRDWLKRTLAENKTCIDLGGVITDVIVTPEDFFKYCNALGLAVSYFNFEVYAIVRSNGG